MAESDAGQEVSTVFHCGVTRGEADALHAVFQSLLPGYVPNCDAVPIILPALLLGAEEATAITQDLTPPEGKGSVHEAQVFQDAGGLDLDCPLSVTWSVTKKDDTRVFDFALPGGQAMQTRLRFVTPELMGAFKGTQFRDSMKSPDMQWVEAGPFNARIVARYLELAHDDNPIHRGDVAARAVGLSGAIVPGMLIAGLCDPVLTMTLPGVRIADMRTRFMAPVPLDLSLRYGVTLRKADEKGRPQSVRLFTLTPENMIAAITDLQIRPES